MNETTQTNLKRQVNGTQAMAVTDDIRFYSGLSRYDLRVANQLEMYGLKLSHLRKLGHGKTTTVVETLCSREKKGVKQWRHWRDLLAVEFFEAPSMLVLVNFCRTHGIELPWFDEWDRENDKFLSIYGRWRAPKVPREL